MNFELAHKIVTYLFAGLGLGLLLSTPLLAPIAKAMVAIAILVTWFLERPLINRKGYSNAIATGAFLVLALQIVRIVLGARLLELGVEYAICLQVLKLAQRRNAADHRQVTILGFLHLIAASVLAFDLEYAVVFVGFVLVTPWMLTLTHLRSVIEEQVDAEQEMSSDGSLLRNTPLPFRSFFMGTAALSIPLFMITAMLFFAFPRIGWGYLSRFSSQKTAVAGFGDDINLGGFGAIRDDPTVVMRIRVPGVSGERPKLLPIRLRGTSFDLYQNSRWTRRPSPRRDVLHRGDIYPIVREVAEDDRFALEITIENIDEPVLFLPTGTIELGIPPRVSNGYPRYRDISYGQGFDFRYRASDDAFSYTAYTIPGLYSFYEAFSEADRAVYLSVPPHSAERIAELARQVTTGLTNPGQQAEKIEKYLSKEGGYTYTLTQPEVGDEDPLEVFLFKARGGHCEYFSTAMIMMLRSLGIPARNVTGFLGAELNSYADYYVVRNANAHSWVEAYVHGQWITYDPTPADRRVVVEPQTWLKTIADMVDALRVAWADYIIDYDLKMQQEAWSKAVSWLRSQQGAFKTSWGRQKESAESQVVEEQKKQAFSKARAMVPWIALGVLVLVGIGFGINALRKRRRYMNKEVLATRVYKALEHRLRAKGFARSPDATPLEFSKELRDMDFEGVDVVDEVTQEYLHSRFGGKSMSAAQYQRLMKRVKSVSDHSGLKKVPNTKDPAGPHQKSAPN